MRSSQDQYIDDEEYSQIMNYSPEQERISELNCEILKLKHETEILLAEMRSLNIFIEKNYLKI